MTVRIPIVTKYDGSGFAPLRRDVDQTERQMARMRRLQERHERAVTQELKQQIAQRRRLLSLTGRLDRELAGPRGRGGGVFGGALVGGALGAGGALILTDMARRAAEFGVEAEKMGRQSAAAEARLTKLLGSTQAYNEAIRQGRDVTQGMVSEVKLAEGAFLLLDSKIADSTQEAAELSRAGNILISAFEAQGASQEKYIRLLSSGNQMLLDNFNLTLAQVNARKALIERTTGLTGEEAKLAAIKELVKEKANFLASSIGEAEKAERRLETASADLQAALGENLAPAFETARNAGADFLNALTRGIKVVRDADDSLVRSTANYQEWLAAVNEAADGNATLLRRVYMTEAQYNQLKQELAGTTQTVDDMTDTIDENTDALDENNSALDEQAKRLEQVNRRRQDFARDLLEIDERAREDTQAAWDDFYKSSQAETEKHNQTLIKLQQDAAKDMAKIDRDLQKDLQRIDADLQKSLEKSRQDERRQIKEIERRAAREEKAERRRSQVEALADKRLFDFELRQLAARGEGNRILEMLERRQIEEQIAKEKATVEQEIEEDKRADEIRAIKESAEISRQELRTDAEEKKRLRQEDAEEEKRLRQERLQEELAEEQTSYEQRMAELANYRDQKLAEIEASKEEAIQKLGEEMAAVGDLTAEEMKALIPVAGELGEEAGKSFAEGLNEGFRRNQRINQMLRDQEGFTPKLPTGVPAPVGPGGIGGPQGRFQRGGSFMVGGFGGSDSQLVSFMATPGERVTVTPPSQGGPNITINAQGVAISQLVAILERKTNEALQEYTDTVLGPALK